MDNYRLKIKIAGHEFEAEGDPETVREQFQAFKELVQGLAVASEGTPTKTYGLTPVSPVNPYEGVQPVQPVQQGLQPVQLVAPLIDESLPRIMRVDNRVISLTVSAGSTEDAILLLLYGQKVLRNSDSVTGAEVMDGLEMSGVRVPRVDKFLMKLAERGDVIAVGLNRGKRYRLTNTGITKARALASEQLATVA